MLWIILAFVVGMVFTGFMLAYGPVVQARITAGKAGIFDHVVAFVCGLMQSAEWVIESILGDKPTAPPAPPAAK